MHLQAKDTYHARCFELEKLKRESANQKDYERTEMKMKRARGFMFAASVMYNVFSACHLFLPMSESRHKRSNTPSLPVVI